MVAQEEGGVRGELHSGLPAVVLLLMGTLGISTAFGMLLLLPSTCKSSVVTRRT
ncbi:hypothetical protein BH24ACT17_BH24ACT17_07160 [soil metagenome]